jgi:hypothetical protein
MGPTRWEFGNKEHKLFGEKVAERRDPSTSPPGKYRRIPSKQAIYHFEHSLSLGALGMKSQGHGKLWRHKAETLKAKGHGELEDERAPRVGEKQDMDATRGMNPFLKADFPARAPKRHGQGLPRCAPGFPSYDMGQAPHVIQAGPKREEGESSHRERATTLRLFALPSSLHPVVKEANRRIRSVQPPRGCAPPRL